MIKICDAIMGSGKTSAAINYMNSHPTQKFIYIIGETELSVIGEQLNAFLIQCGYVRKNDYILMEDITEEEYDALADYLHELRKG